MNIKNIINQIKLFKPTNENWVSKILKKRIYRPVYLAIFIGLSIFTYNLYESYVYANSFIEKKVKLQKKIDEKNSKLQRLNLMIKNQAKQISFLQGLHLDSNGPISVLTKVCDLLKDRDVMGSFYIKKRQSEKFSNVLDIEIEVSYGDRDLLFLVVKMVMDKVFYLKSIEQTKLGLKCELYKPSK